MPYRANRGGHAPGHLRDALLEYFDLESESDKVIIGYEEHVIPLRWLLGQLWNCTDVLPSQYCEILGIDQGSTYAIAVRMLKSETQTD